MEKRLARLQKKLAAKKAKVEAAKEDPKAVVATPTGGFHPTVITQAGAT